MAHNDVSEYPEIIGTGTISTAADIGENAVPLRVAWIKVSNTTGATAVLAVQGHGGTTTAIDYDVDIPDEGEWNCPSMLFPEGLRLASASALQYIVTSPRF